MSDKKHMTIHYFIYNTLWHIDAIKLIALVMTRTYDYVSLKINLMFHYSITISTISQISVDECIGIEEEFFKNRYLTWIN